MILLRLISWPYARKHLLRCLLTTAGIVLGVGVFVGMHTANQSVLAAFHQTIDRIAGTDAAPGIGGRSRVSTKKCSTRCASLPEVRAAAPVIEATVADRRRQSADSGRGHAGRPQPAQLRSGGDRRGHRRSAGVSGAARFADGHQNVRRRERAGDRTAAFPCAPWQGDQVFTVRGIMKPGGLASAFGGDLAIMDIYAAQKVFRARAQVRSHRHRAAGRRFARRQARRAKLQAAAGPGFQVEPPSSRGEQFEATSHMYALASNITSVFALFIGMFIIYNTFAIAVTQRRCEIGILRALGATRGQIRTLFLDRKRDRRTGGDAARECCSASRWRARWRDISAACSTEVYGVAQSTGDLDTRSLADRRGGRDGPGHQPDRRGDSGAQRRARGSGEGAAEGPLSIAERRRESHAATMGARVRAWLSIVALALQPLSDCIRTRAFCWRLLAAVLLSPALALWLPRTAAAVRGIRPVEGTLAADSLIQAPRRTSGTVAALMLSLALVISLSGLARASYDSITEWMRIALNPDFFVTTAETLSARSFVFPASLAEACARLTAWPKCRSVRSVRVW